MEKRNLSRRGLLTAGAASAGALSLAGAAEGQSRAQAAKPAGKPIVRTVLGDIPPEHLGITLVHEHLSLQIGDGKSLDWTYTRDLDLMVNEVTLAGLSGVSCMVDTSMDDLKVSLPDLRTMSQKSGVHVVCAVGHYVEKFYPAEFARQSDDEIAAAMIKRATEMPAGLIAEIGSSGTKEQGWITEAEKKVFRAAAKAHFATNLKILTHTPNGNGAIEQLDLLESLGVKPENIAIGHIDCIIDFAMQEEIAKRGAWGAYDRIGLDGSVLPNHPFDGERARMITKLIDKGYADKILLSADTARPWRTIKYGGKGYAETITHFVPRLREAGVPPLVLNQIVRTNPAKFLAFVPKA